LILHPVAREIKFNHLATSRNHLSLILHPVAREIKFNQDKLLRLVAK
jgi:hypothetical protein